MNKPSLSLDQRLSRASELRAKGYNCAQTVIMAFNDATGLDSDTAARICAGLGGGVGATGEICGVVNAMAIVQGMLHSSDPAKKAEAYAKVKNLSARFAAANCGHVRCRDLKGADCRRPCNDLIADGIRILHEHISQPEL